MSEIPSRLITYCTNIHPGESWEETFAAVRTHVPAVKAAVSPFDPFPIGLRLSERAASELTPQRDAVFRTWLEANDCFVPTINGFPYGSFYNQRIKEHVYLPDWRSRDRAEYTTRLADLLCAWLPEGVTGSISTVPLAYKAALEKDRQGEAEIEERLKTVLAHLAGIYEVRGKLIVLALEPEPGCLLETTDEVCRFFGSLNLPSRLTRHLGICYDCCHQAVQFEDPEESLRRLAAAGVPLAKVQVSAAPALQRAAVSSLRRFDEPCYLHQVVVRREDGALLRYLDLPEAFSSHDHAEGDEWRCHFHVPIFLSRSGHVGTTQPFLTRFLPLLPEGLLLEVETYTWDVLPPELRTESVTRSIIREMTWLKERLHA